MTEAREATKARAIIARNIDGMNRVSIQISKIEMEITKNMAKLPSAKGTKRYAPLKKKIENLLARRNTWVDKYTAYENEIASLAVR